MSTSSTTAPLVLITALLGPAAGVAHHSHTNIDRNNIQRHTGIANEYGWSMPHVYLKVRAPNPAGEIVEYSIELLHPPGMLERGGDRHSFEPGERITWEGAMLFLEGGYQ